MEEQKNHLKNLFQQKQNLFQEIDTLQNQLVAKKELYLKVQGALEYLSQIGVSLDETENQEEVFEESDKL
jgi:hypothetical protein